MRKVLLLFMLIPGMLSAQVVYEDFESGLVGEWLQTAGERWEADSLLTINGNFTLHHSFDNSESGCDQIGISIYGLQPALSGIEWNFKIRHAYNPSSSNNWSFFLMSNESPPGMRAGGTVSGFALGVNLSGYNDTLCLWEIIGGTVSAVLSTSLNWQYDIGVDSAAALSVKRSVDGEWKVFIADKEGRQVLIGTGTNHDLFPAGWAGIMYEYSSLQDRKLWIDDVIIEGYFEVDNQAPTVDTAYFFDRDILILKFNEPLADIPGPQCFTLIPGNIVPERIKASNESYILEYDAELTNKLYYELHISNICDLSGNCSDIHIDSIPLAIPEWKDIIISEIMFDPEPPAGLPEAEYIELYNTSGFDLNTSEMKINIGDDKYILPAAQIKSGEYMLIINKNDSDLFAGYAKVLCPENKFSLNNMVDMLLLRDRMGNVIHGVEYDIEWYKNQLKKYGGWSLELIDYDYPFAGRSNWSESNDRSGGTPGRMNSVTGFNPDLERPVMTNIYPLSNKCVHIEFSETMDKGVASPQKWVVNGNSVGKLDIADPLIRNINIELTDSLTKGIIYEISSQGGITDQAGNNLFIKDNRFGIPVEAEELDILFNEILFDPLPGGSEFIELFNPSDKIVDLSDHFIVSYNSETSDTGRIVWLSDACRCLMPGDYFVITADRDAVINYYSCCNEDRVFELVSLPSLPDKGGNLLLYNRNLILIDKMYYSDEMHYAMLSLTSGISLERITVDLPGTDRSNWRSASGTSGYATPGMENSAAVDYEDAVNEDVMSLSSRKISPDDDGFEDYLCILVNSPSEENMLTLQVFNDMGYHVRTLADNLTSGYHSVLIWDGCDDSGHLVKEGIYIIFSKIISNGRPPEIEKKVCAVVYY